MGLRFPEDMEAWRRWERPSRARRAVAAARRRGAAARPEPLLLVLPQGPARVLAVMDSAGPSNRAAVLDAARLLPAHEVAYLGTGSVLGAAGVRRDGDAEAAWAEGQGRLAWIEHVLSIGAHLPAGRAASEWAARRDVEQVVVQHGLLTPWAPPLPHGATALAFTAEDGDFWTGGRRDLSVRVVGSQALWMSEPVAPVARGDSAGLVFLGQMHGRELPRREIVGQTLGFLRREKQTSYRPHPSEKDVLSRAIHAGMRRRGVRFQDTSVPLAQSDADVVSVFSTGVLEAAQRGRRAWVHHDDPPPWLREFWDRYGLARWGQEPTAPVRWSEIEPARAVADHLSGGVR